MDDTSLPRTLPTDPTIHVEPFATHYTLTWKCKSLSQFINAAQNVDFILLNTAAAIDRTDMAGRKYQDVRDLSDDTSIRYIRIEPQAEWSVSWERRTSPTVSMTGTPEMEVCRELHRYTTACDKWPSEAVDKLQAVIESL